MNSFKEFVNKKTREAKKQLETVQKILDKGGMDVLNFLSEEEPYLYLKCPSKNLPFDGVRIYKIGDNIAYRVQKESKTHPFGKAYGLDIEGMYDDLISDEDMNEQKAGKEIIKAVREEFRNFFNKSLMAEKEIRADDMEYRNDPMGRVTISSTGTDYSNTISNTKSYSPL